VRRDGIVLGNVDPATLIDGEVVQATDWSAIVQFGDDLGLTRLDICPRKTPSTAIRHFCGEKASL
jgi:hypothetical protein